MSEKFLQGIEREETQLTENGALGYASSGNALVNFNFKLPYFRKNLDEVGLEFAKCYNYNKEYALKYLFLLRDIREGIGERESFREAIKWVLCNAKNDIKDIKRFLSMIPEFGRWDDLVEIWSATENEVAFDIIQDQLKKDLENLANNQPVSLLAKWLPSVQTGKRKLALKLIKKLRAQPNGIPLNTEKQYRQLLSKLRSKIDVVEVKMSAKEFGDIKYENVPSLANTKYFNSFNKHDGERYQEYLADVKAGKKSINAAVLTPNEIVKKILNQYAGRWGDVKLPRVVDDAGKALITLWENLKREITTEEFILPVCDVSGSMLVNNCNPIAASYGIGIYLSEINKGPYKDKCILFSSRPKYIDLAGANNILEKVKTFSKFNDCSNTDIYKTFMLVLDTAIKNKLTQKELPSSLVIISDMEFDGATVNFGFYFDEESKNRVVKKQQTLFKTIEKDFNDAGYKMPKLIFWNVNSRTNTIPLKENECGVALLSGLSVNIVKMVLSNKLDPWEILKEQIENPRYDFVKECIK